MILIGEKQPTEQSSGIQISIKLLPNKQTKAKKKNETLINRIVTVLNKRMHRWLHSFSAKHQTLQFDFIPSNHSPIHFDRLIFIGKNYHVNAKKYFVSGRRTCAKSHAWPTIWRPVQVLNRNKTWYVWFDSCHSATPLRDLSLCVGANAERNGRWDWVRGHGRQSG